MQDPMIDSSAPLSDWFDGSTLCLRLQDKLAMTQIPAILRGPKPYVVVTGPSAPLISHYFESIYRKIKAEADLIVDVFLPATADGLLGRFNEVLADLSVAEARQPPGPDAQRRILMLSESADLGQREWDLLARLLSDFPGANFGLLVFVDEPENALVQGFMQAMGSKLHHCSLNFPNAQELQALLDSAAEQERKIQVIETLRQLGVKVMETRASKTQTDQAKPNPSNADAVSPSKAVTNAEPKSFRQAGQLMLGLFVAIVVAISVSLALNDELDQSPESSSVTDLPVWVPAWVPAWMQEAWQRDNEPDATEPQSPNPFLSEPPSELPSELPAELSEPLSEALSEPLFDRVSKPVSKPVSEQDQNPFWESTLVAMPDSLGAIKGSSDGIASDGISADGIAADGIAADPVTPDQGPTPRQVPEWIQALRQPTPAVSRAETEAEKVPAIVPQVSSAELTLDPNAYYLQFIAVQVKENALREQERLVEDFETHILRLRSANAVLFVVLAGPYVSLSEATRAKEVANNVDVIIVRGALLQRRQVL